MFVFLVQRLPKFFDCRSGEDQLPIKALDTILRIAKSEAKFFVNLVSQSWDGVLQLKTERAINMRAFPCLPTALSTQ